MEKKHWSWWMSLAALALAVLLLFPGSVRAEAREVYVSGTVYASRLPDNAKVFLTGNTSIVINGDKTLTCISGQKYDLILSRDADAPNATLTLANFREAQVLNVIDVNTFTTNASVAIKGTFIAAQRFYGCGIQTKKWMQFESTALGIGIPDAPKIMIWPLSEGFAEKRSRKSLSPRRWNIGV